MIRIIWLTFFEPALVNVSHLGLSFFLWTIIGPPISCVNPNCWALSASSKRKGCTSDLVLVGWPFRHQNCAVIFVQVNSLVVWFQKLSYPTSTITNKHQTTTSQAPNNNQPTSHQTTSPILCQHGLGLKGVNGNLQVLTLEEAKNKAAEGKFSIPPDELVEA